MCPGLGNSSVDARLLGLANQRGRKMGGAEQDRHARSYPGDLASHLQPILHRHVKIQDNQVGLRFQRPLHYLSAIDRFSTHFLVRILLDQTAQNPAYKRAVIGDQDSNHECGPEPDIIHD
jgi:hypothetical protein